MLDCRLLRSIIENQLLKKKKFVERQAAFEFSGVAPPEVPVLAGEAPRREELET